MTIQNVPSASLSGMALIFVINIALIAAVIYITANAHQTQCRKEELVFINGSPYIVSEEQN